MPDAISEFETITPDVWMSNEAAYKEKLLNLSDWSKIPLINSNASHNLLEGQLVRFRGMLQDMHNPEFYFEHFEVYNTVTNEVKMKSGKYRDTADILANEKINYTENLVSAQRQTMVVVSIPGLNEWAKNLEDKQNHLKHLEELPNSSKRLTEAAKLKRSFHETEESDMETGAQTGNKEPRVKETLNTGNPVSREHLLNFPLPDVSSKSCIVKVYEEDSTLKLNDLIEVIGFLSVDPSLSGEFRPEDSPLQPVLETEAEVLTHNPPPSLVPRVHAALVRRLPHCNPLLPPCARDSDHETALKEANTAREHLLKALTELLLGDKLAAEYLICHLISCVYLRQDSLTLGQFSLNLSNVPARCGAQSYPRRLHAALAELLTHSYYLPLTIDNLNNMDFVPKKDYECNRLTSGILQLSAHTHLILDETCLSAGQLGARGLGAVAALGELLTNQRVEYDFNYYKMHFDADVPVLVLSEGRSLLPCDYHVPLRPEESSLQIFDAIAEATAFYLKEDIMNLIRRYLTNLKLAKYTIGEDLQFVEDDFIRMRSESTESEPVTAEHLHRLLVLARLAARARGRRALDRAGWDIAVRMEEERMFRLKNRVGGNS